MAIRKSLVEHSIHYWSRDHAFAQAAEADSRAWVEAWEAFLKERDPGRKMEILQPFVADGETPATFTIAPLDRESYLQVNRLPGLDSNIEAVALGLRDLSGFYRQGEEVKLKFTPGLNGGRRLHRDSLDAIFDPKLITELAVAIVEISTIDPTRGQG